MADLAELGIVIKSDADKASIDLDKMTKSAIQADKAADTLNKTSSGLNSTLSSLQQATQRVMGGFNTRTLTDFSSQVDKAGTAAQQAAARFNAANDAFTKFGQGIGASSASVRAATDAYLQASSKLNTLAKDTATVSQAQGVLKEAYKAGQINAAQYTASLAQLETTHQTNARTAKIFGGSLDGVKKSMADVGQGAAALTSILGGLGLVFGAKHILEQADEYTQLQAKIKLITQATGDYLEVSRGLFDASIKTGTVLEGNIRLFQQLSLVTHALGVNNGQLVSFIASFDKLAAINKLDAGHLNSTILELSHALEQGTVRAQQFNRLLLDFPAIGKVIQDGLGKSLIEIREQIKKGELSSTDLFNAITKGLKDVDAQFASLPPSLARSLTSFNTQMDKAFAQITRATGTINTLSAALDSLGKHADIVAAAMVGLGVVLGGAALAGIVALLGPATLLVSVLGALAAAAVYFGSQTTTLQKIQDTHITTVQRAVEIEKELKTTREQSTAALKNEQLQQIRSTQLLIEDTEKRLQNIKVLYQQQQALQEEEFKKRQPPKLRPGEVDITAQVVSQNGFFDTGGYKDKIADLDKQLKEYKGTQADLVSIMKTGLTVQQAAEMAAAGHATEVKHLTDAQQKEADALRSNLDGINLDYANTLRLVEAKKKGADAYADMVNQINAENKANSIGLKPGTDLYNNTVARIKSTEELNDKLKDMDSTQQDGMRTQAEYNDLLSQMGLLGKENAGQLAVQRIEQFKMTDAYKQASPAYQDYINKLETGIGSYKDTEVASVKARKAMAEFNAQYEKLIEAKARPWIQASEDIQRGLGESIEKGITEGFKNGENPLKAFGEIIKATIIKTFANAMAASIVGYINPAIASIASAAQGQAVGNKVGSQLGVGNIGGQGNGSILNIFSGAKNLVGGTGGLTAGIDSFGASSFGLSPGASFVGPLQPGVSSVGSLGTGASLSGLLGAAGGGALIGSLGLFGGNKTGSTIGGGLGGIGGSLVGSAAAGTATAALGATIGSVVPVVGTIAGALLGSLVGSMFGGGKPVVASEFQGGATNGALTGATFGSKGTSTDGAKTLSSGLDTFLKTLQGSGINISDAQVRGAINSKQGNKFDILGASGLGTDVLKSFSFDPSNQDSVSSAIAAVGVELAKGANVANKSLNTALQNIQTSNRKAEDIINDLSFAANFDKLGEAPKVIGQYETAAKNLLATFQDGEERTNRLGLELSKYKEFEVKATKDFFDAATKPAVALTPLQQQLKDLNASFDDLRQAATVLGYSIDDVNAAQKVMTAQLTGDFNKGIKDQIQQITDPVGYAVAQLDKNFESIRSDAAAVGGDLDLVNKLYSLQLANILKDTADQQATIIANDNTIVRSSGQIIADQVKLFDLQTDALNQQIDAQNELAKAAQETRDNFAKLADTLGTLKDSLLTDSSLSPYSPEQRYQIAQDQFNSVSQAALLGDQDALAKLPDVSKQLLSASKDYNGMFAGYVADFDKVQDVLGRTRDLALRQVAVADQQLAAANQQVSLLQQQVDLLAQVKTSLQDSFNAQSSTGSGTTAINPASVTDAGLASRNVGDAVDLNAATGAGISYRQYWTFATLAGYTGNFGAGGFNAYARSNATAAAEFNQLVKAAGGTPVQFAVGGFTPSLAPYIAGENGPEVIWDKKPKYVSNAHETRRMLNGNAGSDDLTIAVRELIGEIRKGNNITVSGTQSLHEVLTEISSGARENADNMRKMAYKKNGTQ